MNAVNLHGNTPLHYAAHFSFQDIAFELMNAGALLLVCNRYDQTSLDLSKPILSAQLISLAKMNNQNLQNRVAFIKADSNWRSSQSKSLTMDQGLSNQQSMGIDIAELSTQFIINSNHSGQVRGIDFK